MSPNAGWELVDTLEKLDDFTERLVSFIAASRSLAADPAYKPVVGFDYETTDLRTFRTHVVGIAVSWHVATGSYITGVCVGPLGEERIANLMRTLRSCECVAHNAVYERGVGDHNGLPAIEFHDTMFLARLLGEEHLGLKALALEHLSVTQVPITDLIGLPGPDQLTMDQVDPKLVAPYAADDAVSTLRLWDLFQETLSPADIYVYENIDRPLIPVIAEMQNEGIALDKTAIATADTGLTKLLADKRTLILGLSNPLMVEGREPAPLKKDPDRVKPVYSVDGRRVGPPVSASYKAAWAWELNPASPTQVQALLDSKDAAAGTLEDMATPLSIGIRDYKHLYKLKTSYLASLANCGDRIHGSWNIVGTGTGRLSASGYNVGGNKWGINLQTLPKPKSYEEKGNAESDLLRACFIADPGCSLIEIDYSQVELRVLAHISGDENLTQAYLDDRDVHDEMMRHSGLADRRLAKILNFGCAYEPNDGSAAWVVKRAAMSQGLRLSEKECYALVAQYRDAWPTVRQYYGLIDELIKKQGYVETLAGRKLRLSYEYGQGAFSAKKNRATLREGVNMPIQGTAADIIKMAWAKLHAMKPDWIQWKNMVHDSLVFQTPIGREQEGYDWAAPIMENIVKLSVPLKVDGTYGPNWKDQVEF